VNPLITLGVAASLRTLSWVYHRYIDDKPLVKKVPIRRLELPRTDQGAPIPLVFGRCLVRSPILVFSARDHVTVYKEPSGSSFFYTTDPTNNSDLNAESHVMYAADLLFAVGIGMGNGFTRGNSLAGNKLHNVWWGEKKLPAPAAGLPTFSSALRYGQMVTDLDEHGRLFELRGAYYWHGGWTDQSLMSPASKIGPGLAKQMLVSFCRLPEDSSDPYFNQTLPDTGGTYEAQPLPNEGFIIGTDASVPSVRFEVSSYGDVVSGVSNHVFSMTSPGVDFGGDADPVECIYDILTGTYGKLGLPTSLIDMTSFSRASQTLKSEGNGYSRCADSTVEMGTWIEEILKQIYGVLRWNPATRKIEIKLIRPDYSPPSLPRITRERGHKLVGGAMSGWTNLVNKVRVPFQNRDRDWADDSAAAQNPADATSGQTEQVIAFPGCVRFSLAQKLAERELAWLSKPLMKMTAHVDRSFLRVSVGDPIVVNWTDPNISNVVFRVASVNHGKLADGQIILSLIQDVNYVWRNQTPKAPKLPFLDEPWRREEP
jgi:hypothetical protein